MNQYNKEQLKYSGYNYNPTVDPILAGMGVTDETGNPNQEEEQGGNFDPEAWGNGLGSVLDGVGGLLSGIGVGGNNNNNLPTNTGVPNSNEPRNDEDKKPNYTIWIILALVILIMIVAFVMLRKKGSSAAPVS